MPAEMPPDRVTIYTRPVLHDHAVTEKIWRVYSPEHGEDRAIEIYLTVEANRLREVAGARKRDSERR